MGEAGGVGGGFERDVCEGRWEEGGGGVERGESEDLGGGGFERGESEDLGDGGV